MTIKEQLEIMTKKEKNKAFITDLTHSNICEIKFHDDVVLQRLLGKEVLSVRERGWGLLKGKTEILIADF